MWWNVGLSPPTSQRLKNQKKMTKEERLVVCAKKIKQFMNLGFDFICLGEVSSEDVVNLSKELNLTASDYTVVDGYNTVGRLIFDTCIFYKKIHKLVVDIKPYENLVYTTGGRNSKVGQRFEFKFLPTNDVIVLFLSHWSGQQSTDDKLYESIAQDLRNALKTDILQKKHIILLGDYNVEPHHQSMVSKLQTSREKELVKYRKTLFYNPFWKFLPLTQDKDENKLLGTYHLRQTGLFNDWHVIDQILISSLFFDKKWKFDDDCVEIIDTNYLLEDPVSDHMAISMLIERVV
ncbi:endonuclease/exonuclease/phosphatase family protein [Acinetobacter baumannii]|uniref:Endonuclease/Exonuclease/phosphatase family protein n=1 Tax=Acinetobacter nosocomialis 28F TaxID=1147131 RepID=A0AA36K9T5_ACINO|nr:MULTISPECIES: endonuclease/exonuclease/phosphatase family protein [Acinetobacter]MCG5960723.1 endonuclease/exonuclease/phosphatase family protein [Acinetobacter baumannii]PNH14259.1 hypothetical protein DSM30011_012755 [Acinetobacter baumannii]UMO41681.1 endonuclease/exonuclease/phosphatase family protein [Acinetobacter baumannii]CDG74722.1 Endonuclease/Exonuclease/phosphatase family protein [Acinetobacter nosocomialis 28F]HAV5496011.1 endonuclease/exonuclease/phosphatase family protein [Ac